MADNLKDVVRKIIVDRIKSHIRPKVNPILIEDTHSNRLRLECKITEDDLQSLGVRDILILQSKRTEKKDEYGYRSDAIYLLSPTLETIELVLEDFTKGKELYMHAHFYFTSPLSDDLFEKLSKGVPTTIMETCVELNLDFLPYESRVFHFNLPNTLYELYKAQSEREVEDKLDLIAKKFRGVLHALNEDPVIRFFDPNNTQNNLSARLAKKIHREVKDMKNNDPSFPTPTPFDIHGPATVLIADRSIDVVTPLIHSFGYQALVYDSAYSIFEDTSNGMKRITIDIDESEPAVIDETNELFGKLRHEYFTTVLDLWQAENAEFTKFKDNKATTVQELKARALKKSEIEKRIDQLHSIFRLNETLTDMLKERKFASLGEFEQDLTVGETVDGSDARVNVKDLKNILLEEDVDLFDKLRVFALYVILVGGLKPEDVDSLGKVMGVEPLQLSAIKGLAYLGVTPSEPKDLKNPASPFMYQSRKKKGKEWSILNFMKQSTAEDKDVIAFDRFQPALSYIIDDHLNGKSNFTVLDGTGQSRQATNLPNASVVRKAGDTSKGKGVVVDFKNGLRPAWAKKRIPAEGDESESYRHNGARLIILIIGGVSYAEIRSVYLAAKKMKREIIIGSTSALHDLGKLESPPFVYPQFLSRRISQNTSQQKSSSAYDLVPTSLKSEQRHNSENARLSHSVNNLHEPRSSSQSSPTFAPALPERRPVQQQSSGYSATPANESRDHMPRPTSTSSVSSFSTQSSYLNQQNATSPPSGVPNALVAPPRTATSSSRTGPSTSSEKADPTQGHGYQSPNNVSHVGRTATPPPRPSVASPQQSVASPQHSVSSPAIPSPTTAGSAHQASSAPRSPFMSASTVQSQNQSRAAYFGQAQATSQGGYYAHTGQQPYANSPAPVQVQAQHGGSAPSYGQTQYAGNYPKVSTLIQQPRCLPSQLVVTRLLKQGSYASQPSAPFTCPRSALFFAFPPSSESAVQVKLPKPPAVQSYAPAAISSSGANADGIYRDTIIPTCPCSAQYHDLQHDATADLRPVSSSIPATSIRSYLRCRPGPNVLSSQPQYAQYQQHPVQVQPQQQQRQATAYANYAPAPPGPAQPRPPQSGGYSTAELQAMYQRGQLRNPQGSPPDAGRRY
ncbi:Sec1-like protein [Chytridium lagenaria]|nr:Sec1-like protein [Chytridium lagenaria]